MMMASIFDRYIDGLYPATVPVNDDSGHIQRKRVYFQNEEYWENVKNKQSCFSN